MIRNIIIVVLVIVFVIVSVELAQREIDAADITAQQKKSNEEKIADDKRIAANNFFDAFGVSPTPAAGIPEDEYHKKVMERVNEKLTELDKAIEFNEKTVSEVAAEEDLYGWPIEGTANYLRVTKPILEEKRNKLVLIARACGYRNK